jgi:hypothetical protein
VDFLTVAQLCDLSSLEIPDAFGQFAVDSARMAALREGQRSPAGAQGGGANVQSATVMCQPATDSNDIEYFDCTVDPLAPGEMATIELQVTADQVGVFRNVAATFPNDDGGICDGGDRMGQGCDDEEDCPGGGCKIGFCQGGDMPGNGCDEDLECGETGDCVNCNTCQIAGVCIGGADQGAACLSIDDCNSDANDPSLFCFCGRPVDCTFTTVVARGPASAPVLSSGGWAGAIAALLGIAALAMRRRLGGVSARPEAVR